MTQAPTGALASSSSTEEAPPTFDVIALSPAVRRAIDEMGYTSPTPVQRAVFEPASRGGDLVVQARTGTGKTAAFGLPVVDRLVRSDVAAVQVLVLSPTRELALQISRQLEQIAAHTSIKTTAIYGGAAMQPQIDALRSGVQIVAGTPGRVLDHLERGTLDVGSLRTFVLDESDEMLSMGFLPQITAIMERLPRDHQTLLFSATLPPGVKRIAESRLKNPEFITLSGDHIGALEIQHFVYTSRGDKSSELAQIIEIENPESAIVFCNTREQTKRIAQALQKRGFAAEWLNADLSQSDREKVMQMTRESRLRFLVATDVAARGIDISHLTHVINADFPESTENYVHRTGRTGRAGRTGTAISLIAPQDVGNLYMLRLTYKIFPIARELPSARDLETRRETDLIESLLDRFPLAGIRASEQSLARRVLTSENAERIVAGLLGEYLGKRPTSLDEAENARRAKMPARAPESRHDEKRDDAKTSRDGTRDGRSSEAHRDERANDRDGERHGKKDKKHKKNKKKDEKRRSEDEPRADESRSEPEAREADDREEAAPESARRETVEDGRRLESVSAAEVLGSLSADDPVERVFVDVGRRDGAYREDFIEALEEHGLHPEDIRFVKVRDTHTFVGVPADLLDRALAALDGANVAGCTARAEKARPKSRDD